MNAPVDVVFETSKGTVKITVHPEWAPRGAERFLTLVREGFFDGCRFFRVLEDFVAQFGLSGDPARSAVWRDDRIPDDPVLQSNKPGTLTFATAGPGTRTTQIFVNYGHNGFLDDQGFAPFAEITEGLDVVQKFYAGYGDGAPQGRGPSQHRLEREGNAYLLAEYPKLDFIETARVV